MIDRLARLVSIVIHPAILILAMPFLVVYRQTESSFYALKWQIFSAGFVLFAGFLVLLGERLKIFSDSDLSKKGERYRFYTMVSILVILYIAIVVFLKGIFFPFVIIGFGALFGITLFAIANHFFKISMHSGAVCAFVISVGILYGANALLAIVWIVPFMIWARIRLKKHTIMEAFSGGALGGIIALVTFLVGRRLL